MLWKYRMWFIMIKKNIVICFVILLLLSISGCIDEKIDEEIDEEKIESVEEVQEAIVTVGENISEMSDSLESITKDLG